MKTVLGYTPPSEALVAEPYTLEEIDSHPDAIRLWATFLAVTAEYDKVGIDLYHDGYETAVRDYGL